MTRHFRRLLSLFAVLVPVCLSAFFPWGCAVTDSGGDATNQLTDVAVCAVLVENRCVADESEFVVQAKRIHVTATVEDVVPGSEAKVTLARVTEGTQEKVLSYSVNIEPDEETDNAALVFFFDNSGSPENGEWSAGEYEIELTVDAADVEPVKKTINMR